MTWPGASPQSESNPQEAWKNTIQRFQEFRVEHLFGACTMVAGALFETGDVIERAQLVDLKAPGYKFFYWEWHVY